MKAAIFYEIYPKRAIHEPIAGLVMLGRDANKKKAIKTARQWGACVVWVKAQIINRRPLVRTVLDSRVVWVHKPAKPANEERDKITRRQLITKLRANDKSLYKKFKR